jgi:hypothetical protein
MFCRYAGLLNNLSRVHQPTNTMSNSNVWLQIHIIFLHIKDIIREFISSQWPGTASKTEVGISLTIILGFNYLMRDLR